MDKLQMEINAYEAMKQELEARSWGKCAVLHDGELVGTYDSFEEAAQNAVARFGRGPYLIREVGQASLQLPQSSTYYSEQ